MTGIWTFLQGKKAYLVCMSGILTALVAWLNGAITAKDFVEAVFLAVAGITLRAGAVNAVRKVLAEKEQS